ncbi:MAG: hypothetical protein IPJ66_06420 [Bacteroidetes bacterium]|nr:hypothetical protein [Bacteroidota bacterium]
MVRIFLAFPLPLNLRKQLQQMFSGYSNAAGFRWAPEENLHITIFFIGEVEEEKIPLIREKINFADTAGSLQCFGRVLKNQKFFRFCQLR